MLLKFNYNVSFAEKNYHNILSQWFTKKKKKKKKKDRKKTSLGLIAHHQVSNLKFRFEFI